MKRNEINRHLHKSVIQSAELGHKWAASKAVFDAAVFVGDGEEAQKCREKLHALLDLQLDNASNVMTLSRKLAESTE